MDGMAEHAARFTSIIHDAGTVAVGAHVDADGDAVGSTLGLVLALRGLGVEAVPVIASGTAVPETYAFLPGSALYRDPAGLEPPDVFIALDTPTYARLGAAEGLARAASHLIVIDHHPDNTGYGTLSMVDATASSVGAMVWALLHEMDAVIDADIATCLYTALVTDTGRFSYSNTTPRSLRTAAEMIEHGVDVQRVFTDIYESRSAGALGLIGRTLERITCVDEGAIAYSRVDAADFADTGALKAESENLIDEIRALKGARVVFLMKATNGVVRVSLRAKGDTDVGSIARGFGGGGHHAAAGFTFDGDFDGVLDVLLPALREALA